MYSQNKQLAGVSDNWIDILKGTANVALDYKRRKQEIDLAKLQAANIAKQNELEQERIRLYNTQKNISQAVNNPVYTQGTLNNPNWLPYALIGVPILILLLNRMNGR